MATRHREWHDIGHGIGNRTAGVYDSGAVNKKPDPDLHEHKEVERFVERLAAAREADGALVLVTEDMDVTKRDDKAKKFGAVEGYSWHLNSSNDPNATGLEILVNSNASEAWRRHLRAFGMTLAAELGVRWRGLKVRDNLAVLRSLKDDCIVELVFVSNLKDMANWGAKWKKTAEKAAELLRKRHGKAPVPVKTVKSVKTADSKAPAWPGGPAIKNTVLNRRRVRAVVAAWQVQMRRRGWKITVDGKFGPDSERIALAFQSEKRRQGWHDMNGKRMVVDGILGPQLWEAAFTSPITS